jgi:hypothetical protein
MLIARRSIGVSLRGALQTDDGQRHSAGCDVSHGLGAQPIVPTDGGGYFDSDLPVCPFGGLHGAAVSG